MKGTVEMKKKAKANKPAKKESAVGRAAAMATRHVNALAECPACGAGLGKPCTDGEGPLRDDLAHNPRIEAAEKAARACRPRASRSISRR